MLVLTSRGVGLAPGTMVPSVGMKEAIVGGRVMAGATVTIVGVGGRLAHPMKATRRAATHNTIATVFALTIYIVHRKKIWPARSSTDHRPCPYASYEIDRSKVATWNLCIGTHIT